MRKLSIAMHALLAVVLLGVLGTLWAFMLARGTGDLLSPFRSVRIGPARVVQYLLAVYSLVGIPAGVLSACRVVQLGTGRFGGWRSLRPMSNLFAVLGVLLIVVAVAAENPAAILRSLPFFGAAQPPPGPTEDRLEYPALPLTPSDPYAWSVYDLDGNEVPLSTFRGKVVFINAWATWCGFCLREFPNIQRLYDGLKDHEGIAFLIVSPEEPETVRAWAAEQDYTLPFYTLAASAPPEGEAAAEPRFPPPFSVRGLPTTFILAPDGQLAFQHSGMAAWDGEKTVAFLNALAETATEIPR